MGHGMSMCLESRVQGLWTHLASFDLVKDYENYSAIVRRSWPVWHVADRGIEAGPDWSPMTRYIAREFGDPSTCGEIRIPELEAIGKEQWLVKPWGDTVASYHTRRYLEAWLSRAIARECSLVAVELLASWPLASEVGLGEDARLCWWIGGAGRYEVVSLPTSPPRATS